VSEDAQDPAEAIKTGRHPDQSGYANQEEVPRPRITAIAPKCCWRFGWIDISAGRARAIDAAFIGAKMQIHGRLFELKKRCGPQQEARMREALQKLAPKSRFDVRCLGHA